MHETCIGTINMVTLATDKIYNGRELIFKNFDQFTGSISKISNTQTLI